GVEATNPGTRREAAGQDDADVRRCNDRQLGELASRSIDQAPPEGDVAEHRPGLDGAGGVAGDHPVGDAQLGGWQLRGPVRERLEIAETSANEVASSARRASRRCSTAWAVARGSVPARRRPTSDPFRKSPVVTFEFPMSTARSMPG